LRHATSDFALSTKTGRFRANDRQMRKDRCVDIGPNCRPTPRLQAGSTTRPASGCLLTCCAFARGEGPARPSLRLSTAVVVVSSEQSASPIRELRPLHYSRFLGKRQRSRAFFAPTGGPNEKPRCAMMHAMEQRTESWEVQRIPLRNHWKSLARQRVWVSGRVRRF
jgi:hypothetical protein